MPRRFFRRFALKRARFHGRWYLAPFDHLLHDPNLWAIRRRTVVPAFALGMFLAFMPAPGHTLIAALTALAMRINIPIAALTTLVSNPLTMGPIYYLDYRIGQRLLGTVPQPFAFEFSLDWLTGKFLEVWQPLLLGGLLLAVLAATIAYFGLDLLWRASVADYVESRRRRR